MRLTIIIPAINEEEKIGQVIDEVKSILPGEEVLVVDNNSKDRTEEIARSKPARVIREMRIGKGNAMLAGAHAATGAMIVFIDGDGEYAAGVLSRLIEPIRNNRYDLVYGSRFLAGSKRKNMSIMRYLGNRFLTIIASLLYRHTSDLLTGVFAIRKDRFLDLDLRSRGFEVESEIFIKAVRMGLKITEIPCSYTARKSSRLNMLTDGAKILRMLIWHRIC